MADFFFNEGTAEALRDLLNPRAAREKMIARAEAESAKRQQVAEGLANSALAAAGYAPPKPAPKPKKTAEDLAESFAKLTAGQRETIARALSAADAAADDSFTTASELTSGFDAEGSWPLEEDDDEGEDCNEGEDY